MPFRSAEAQDAQAERPLPLNYPRRVQTVRFTVPMDRVAYAPNTTVPPLGDLGVGKRPGFGALAGKPLRYLIGGSAGPGPRRRSDDGELQHQFAGQARHQHRLLQSVRRDTIPASTAPTCTTRTPRSSTTKARSIRRARAGRRTCASSTSAAARPGFEYIELDNPDAYNDQGRDRRHRARGHLRSQGDREESRHHRRPGRLRLASQRLRHHRREGRGGAADMERLRKRAGKPDLPVWFVAFGSGRGWATASPARRRAIATWA